MPLDALFLSAAAQELSARITGLKVDKVYQPERDVLVFKLRGGAGDCRLLFSAGAGDYRLHLTESRLENPASPPMFCMLLRKHLTGARIKETRQPPAERVLEIVFDAWDESGDCHERSLIFELTGRSSNAVLTGSDGKITDCLRRTGSETEGKRVLFPGVAYASPPPQEGKIAPIDVLRAEQRRAETQGAGGDGAETQVPGGDGADAPNNTWRELFDSANDATTADKWLLSTFRGLSPLICREISWRAYGRADYLVGDMEDGGAALRRELLALLEQSATGNAEPWIITGPDGAPLDFSFTRIMQYEGALDVRREAGFSALLDGYYTRAAQITRVRQRASATTKTVKNACDRILRKLAAQREELALTGSRDSHRECGDIIMANMHQMKKGQSTLLATDFHSGGGMREIQLDPLKTPQQNAAKYYKEYTKAKNAERFLSEQILLGENELEYLESVLGAIALAEGEKDLNEIRRELASTGYLKAQKKGKEKTNDKTKGKTKGKTKEKAKDNTKEQAPLRFVSSSGVTVFAGRNNSQNDQLTFKAAFKSDIWLHAQKIHGAHVIISCGGAAPDGSTLSEAASIAAYYSAARGGGKAPVDYTLVKHVKKAPGGRPGMVLYTDHKTIAATPDEELVNSLRV